MTGDARRLTPGERDQLGDEVRALAWDWARRMLELGDGPPASEYEQMPREQARRVHLAVLAACEELRTAMEDRARHVARAAAAAGADYGELADAVGLGSRQAARKRWPGLAELASAARALPTDAPTPPTGAAGRRAAKTTPAPAAEGPARL